MSLNTFPSSDPPEKLWWTQYQPHHSSMDAKPFLNSQPITTHTPPPLWSSSTNPHHQAWLNNNPPRFHNSLSLNLNTLSPNDGVSHQFPGGDEDDSTHHNSSNLVSQIMFEKPLTPSDVGKLNRLVIPKQHAEKYFPLNSSTLSGGDSGGGMLLSFEDESGKLWRFRYSYWNSSQSYVLTKGWSRYVKEKRLDAGDVVLFERHLTDPDRLFIGWRRRADGATRHQDAALRSAVTGNSDPTNIINSTSGEWTRVFYSAHHPYPSQPSPFQPDRLHAAGAIGTSGRNQTTPVGNSRRLRLFGVNMECQVDEDDDDDLSSDQATPDDNASSLSSSGHHQHQFYPEFHAASRHSHMMDIAIARDASQRRTLEDKYQEGGRKLR